MECRMTRLFLSGVALASLVAICANSCAWGKDKMELSETHREVSTKQLLGVLRSRNQHPKSDVVRAIQLLGQRRATNAVDALVEILDYEPEPGNPYVAGPLTTYVKQYPAAGAIVQIGVPAVDRLIEFLCAGDDRKRLDLADRALTSILGIENKNVYLRRAIRRAQDEHTAARLRQFIVDAPGEE